MKHKKQKNCVNCKNSYRVYFNHVALYRCKIFDNKVVSSSDSCKEYTKNEN